jgi:hypothetical protein
MIRAELSFLPLLYTSVLLAAVLVLWLVGAWRRSRRRRREWRSMGQCRLCAAWVRPAEGTDLWRCPACRALNERTVPADL